MMVQDEFWLLILVWVFVQPVSGARSAWASCVTRDCQSKPEARPEIARLTPEELAIIFYVFSTFPSFCVYCPKFPFFTVKPRTAVTAARGTFSPVFAIRPLSPKGGG